MTNRRWSGRRLIATLVLLVAATALFAVAVVAGPATARPARAATACPDFSGPVWIYKTGVGASAPIYKGTRYTFSTVRLTCPAALRLIRKIIPKTAQAPGPAARKYAAGYGCIVGSQWLIGKKMFAGQCFSAPSGKVGPGAAGGFAWSPKLLDPSSKRIK
jgi:hypothetical protein